MSWRGAPPFLAHLFIHFFALVKVSDPGLSRSGHQVTTSDLTSEKVWIHVVATPNDRPLSKLPAIDIRNSIYEMFISQFWYRWPKVRSILRPREIIISQWRKNERRQFWKQPFETLSNIKLQVELTPWVGILRPVTPRHVFKVISGHERSPWTVFRQHLLIGTR